NGRSVPLPRVITYTSSGNNFFHSLSDFVTRCAGSGFPFSAYFNTSVQFMSVLFFCKQLMSGDHPAVTGRSTIDLTVASRTTKALSAIRFSVSRVGLISTISQAHSLGSLASDALNAFTSSTVSPLGTGVPVPVDTRLSIQSTSIDT